MNKPTAAQLNDPQWWGVWAPEDATHYSEYYGAFVKPFDLDQWVVLRQGPKPVVTFMDTGIFISRPEPSLEDAKPAAPKIMPDDCLRARIGEIGNQAHNIGCECQNDEDLSERLGKIACDLWDLAKEVPIEPAAPEWDGSGLPPVGCDCKIARHGHWIPAKIIAHGEDHGEAVAFCQTEFLPLIGDATQFRPIRAQAERDREDLKVDLMKTLFDGMNAGQVADAILSKFDIVRKGGE